MISTIKDIDFHDKFEVDQKFVREYQVCSKCDTVTIRYNNTGHTRMSPLIDGMYLINLWGTDIIIPEGDYSLYYDQKTLFRIPVDHKHYCPFSVLDIYYCLPFKLRCTFTYTHPDSKYAIDGRTGEPITEQLDQYEKKVTRRGIMYHQLIAPSDVRLCLEDLLSELFYK